MQRAHSEAHAFARFHYKGLGLRETDQTARMSYAVHSTRAERCLRSWHSMQ